MLTPFQKLLYNGLGSRKVLIAASGPCLRTFDYLSGQFVSRWSYLDSDISVGDKSPDLHDDDDENSPRKKRKLDHGDASDSVSAEILIENGSGRRKSKRHGFTTPCITHLTGTVDGKHIVIATGEDKTIRVLKMTEKGGLHQFSRRVLPKRPSALTLTPDEDQILCSDKFGDVYSMPLLGQTIETASGADIDHKETPEEELFKPSATLKTVHTKSNLQALQSQQKQKKVKKAPKAELQFEHDLILGHVSLLTDITSVSLQTSGGRSRTYILTSDRDEHIRVSRGIPQAYVIENFCLGHEQFINKIHIPLWQPKILISGGGDDYLAIWDWRAGTMGEKLDMRSLLALSKSDANEINASPISVSGIWSMESTSGNGLIIVACEKMSGLFIFTLSPSGQIMGDKSIFKPLAHNVLDVAIIQHEQRIVVSFDNVHRPGSSEIAMARDQSPFVAVYQLQSDGSWAKTEELTAINTYAQQTTEPLMESLNLATLDGIFYNAEHLRKKGPLEAEEEDEP